MTALVHHPGYPDRLACEQCYCDIAAKREDGEWLPVKPEGQYHPTWLRNLGIDEAPLHLDLTDGCPCHDTYLRMVRFPYE